MRAPHPTAALSSRGWKSLLARLLEQPLNCALCPSKLHPDSSSTHRATRLELGAFPLWGAVTNTQLQPGPNEELMSYVEPLLNCEPLEPSCISPAPTTYIPCSPFTSALFLFFS